MLRLSASSSETCPPNTTFLIASDGYARAREELMVRRSYGMEPQRQPRKRGMEGVIPGRGGAPATAWPGLGSEATQAGRKSRCGSSAPAPSSPFSAASPPQAQLLSLGVSCFLSKREGREDWRRCEPRERSGAGWQDGAGSLFFVSFFFFLPIPRRGTWLPLPFCSH